MGRRSKYSLDVQEVIVCAVEDGATDEQACEAAGISKPTLYTWILKGEDGRAPYRDFLDALTRARSRRPRAIMRTLADESDWRAREAYLKQLQARDTSRANRRLKEAEADIAEAKAEAVRSLASRGGAGMLLLAEDVLGDMPHDLAARVREHFAVKGLGVVERRDLASGVTDDDVANASPTPPDDEAGP
ncbi:MAG: transposase [Microbacteriaceae bacterium]